MLSTNWNRPVADEVAALRGRLVDWDVVNEPYDNHDVTDILGNGELIAWFKLARQNDPDVRLTLNDYAILTAGGMDKAHQDHFEKTLRFLKDGGAPITGLGMQAHFAQMFEQHAAGAVHDALGTPVVPLEYRM